MSSKIIKSVDQLSVSGRRVFLRVDFNVPQDKSGNILDDTRIREALPTIKHLMEKKAKVILASHFGRPKGPDLQYSLIKVAERLTELLEHPVIFPEDCIGDGIKKLAHELREGDVMLLENLRFHPEEKANDSDFAKALSQLAEVYVTDAFGAMHRAHASTSGMVKNFQEKGMGFLVQKEIEMLSKLLSSPTKPFYAVLGGAKVSDKIGLIEKLISKVDGLILGGGLAYTFLKVAGAPIGKSIVDLDKIHTAQRILNKAREAGVPIYLPTDHRVSEKFEDGPAKTVSVISETQMGLDIGPETIKKYQEVLRRAKTVFWNGPMGVFEWSNFSEGTFAVAKALGDGNAFSVVGGGESVAAVHKSGLASQINHLSTGGGASLEYLEGKELPGLKALEE